MQENRNCCCLNFLPTLTAAMTGAVMMDRATPPVMARFLLWRDDFFSS